jgi:outer membrane protein assembly factor BamB
MTALIAAIALVQAPTVANVWSTRLQTEIQSFVVGESVYFGANNSFGALHPDTGKKIWARAVASPQLGVFVAEGDGLLFASVGQGGLGAFNAKSGKPAWSVKRSGYASPIGFYNQSVYASLAPGKLTALQGGSGKPIWTANLEKSYPSIRPIRFGTHIFVGTKEGITFAFDKDTGKLAWKSQERKSGVQALVVAPERLIALHDDGSVIAMSLDTGEKMWAVHTNNGLFGNPLLRDGRLFVTSLSGRFYSIAAQTGQELWVRPLSLRQNFGLTQPIPWRDGLLLGDNSKLVWLNGDGEKQWEVEGGLPLVGNPPRVFGDDLLLTGSHEFRRVRLK